MFIRPNLKQQFVLRNTTNYYYRCNSDRVPKTVFMLQLNVRDNYITVSSG